MLPENHAQHAAKDDANIPAIPNPFEFSVFPSESSVIDVGIFFIDCTRKFVSLAEPDDALYEPKG
jgi:hypothetical protein